MNKGDRFQIFDNSGSGTHYCEMIQADSLSIYTMNGEFVMYANITSESIFNIYNINGRHVFYAIKSDQNDGFSIYSIKNKERVYKAIIQ